MPDCQSKDGMYMRKVGFSFVFLFFTILFGNGEQRPFTLVVGDEPWPGIMTWSDSGEYQGLYKTFLDALAQDRGWSATVKPVPWQRAQTMVAAGEADALIAVASPDRQSYAQACDTPVFSLYFTIYTYRQHPRLAEIMAINSVEDILRLELTTVSNRGNGWHQENVEAKGVATVYVNDDKTMVQFLAARRADIILDTPLSMNHRIQELGLRDTIVSTNIRLDETSLRLLISRKSPYSREFEGINQAATRVIKSESFQDELNELYGQ